MIGALALAFALMVPQDGGQADKPEVARLKGRVQQVQARLRTLVRLRVTHDLLMPIDEKELLMGTTPMPVAARPEARKRLVDAARRTVALREQLLNAQQARPRVAQIETTEPQTPPAGPGPVATKAAAPEHVEPAVPTPNNPVPFDLAPRAAPSRVSEWDRPIVVDPFAQRIGAAIPVEPAQGKLKRADALLQAGFVRQALLLTHAAQEPELMFVHARALEVAGRHEEAEAVYKKLTTSDVQKAADGTEVPGAWARAAKLALGHLEWQRRVDTTGVRKLEKLKW